MQIPDQGLRPTSHHIIKALLASREMLLEELKKISGAVGKTIEDLDDADLSLGKYESLQSSKPVHPDSGKVFPVTTKGVGHLAGILHDFLEVSFIILFIVTYECVHDMGTFFLSWYTGLADWKYLCTILQRPNDVVDGTSDGMLYTLSSEELLELFVTVSSQLSLLWNAFLKFHR